jgi:hypothetical protein
MNKAGIAIMLFAIFMSIQQLIYATYYTLPNNGALQFPILLIIFVGGATLFIVFQSPSAATGDE